MTTTVTALGPPRPSEAGVLAGELAASFGRMVQSYEKHFRLPHAEARERAAEPERGRRGAHPATARPTR